MKLLLSLFTYSCFLLFGVKGQNIPDFNADISELRTLLGIADNVSLVQTVISSNFNVPSEGYGTSSRNIAIRFELQVNSIPVYDAGVTAEFRLNGTYADLWTSQGAEIIVKDNGIPGISSRRALYILARKFNLCPQIKYFQNQDISLFYIMDPVTKLGRLVYRASVVLYGQVTSFGNETTETVQPTAIIDANTGEVIQWWNGLATELVTSKAIFAYGGNAGDVLGTLTYSELVVGLQADGRCIYSTGDVQVQSLGSTTNAPFTPTSFVCDAPKKDTYDNANGGFSPLNDAMKNAQTTVSMYRTYLQGINQPHFQMPVKLRVHFGVNYANAFWDGTFANFGDGSPTTFYPLVTLDNIAHEIAHAFTGYRNGSNLETVGEPGGVNEAFSDMSGQAAVFYSNQIPPMTPGVEFTKTGDPVRNMCNPRSDGASIDHYRSYKKDMDPHYSSGLYNKAFCILSQRGGSWNIGTTFQVFAYANRLYWRPKTNFNQGVCGVQRVARYLLGASAVNDVRDAFIQVGLACIS